MVISELHAFRNIHLSDAPASIILINLVLVLLFLWLQTTAEEIMFRGIFLRAPYGNSVPTLPKGLGFAVFSSILFMALQTANPEVLQLSGTDVIAGAASYFFAGLGLYIANLLIGGMECGLLLHYLNNFYCFVIISEKVTAVATPTIFFKEGETSGMWALISVLIQYALPLIYLAVVYKRKKKEIHDINAE